MFKSSKVIAKIYQQYLLTCAPSKSQINSCTIYEILRTQYSKEITIPYHECHSVSWYRLQDHDKLLFINIAKEFGYGEISKH